MIQIIAGLQGAGKTKNLIELANSESKTSHGHIVYVDADNSRILQLSHKIRLIKPDEYPLETASEFFGFVCGILSQDYDIVTVYIDGLLKNAKAELSNVPDLLHKIRLVSERTDVNFIISMSCDPAALPDDVKEFLI
ncbi:MAG: twitching motility protein PilT [Firmicutes bacterium]|nr:twitching motility protein PilT [Bacillota bacterium]